MARRSVLPGNIHIEKLKFNIPSLGSSESSRSVSSSEDESQYSQSTSEGISETSSEEGAPSLTVLETVGVISVLEDTLDQLSILKYILPGGEIEWRQGYQTLEERFGNSKTEKVLIFPEEYERPILSDPLKIQRDRHFLDTTLSNTVDKLRGKHTYGPLAKTLDGIEQQRKDEEELKIAERGNKQGVRDLKLKITLEKKMSEIKKINRDKQILNLKDKTHDTIVTAQMEFRYVDHWENSRDEQHIHYLKNITDKFEEQLNNLNVSKELENRVHSEIEDYIHVSQKEFEDQIEFWMDRYDSELETKDREIFDLSIKRSKQKQEYADLLEVLEQQRDEMDRYIAYKEEKRREEEQEKHVNAMVTKIQAWWRGVMVRRHLGPFRKQKKGKKGKNDKKGKKGRKEKKGKKNK